MVILKTNTAHNHNADLREGELLDSLKRFFSIAWLNKAPLLHFIPAKEIRTRSEVRPKSKKYVNGQNNEEPTVACSKIVAAAAQGQKSKRAPPPPMARPTSLLCLSARGLTSGAARGDRLPAGRQALWLGAPREKPRGQHALGDPTRGIGLSGRVQKDGGVRAAAILMKFVWMERALHWGLRSSVNFPISSGSIIRAASCNSGGKRLRSSFSCIGHRILPARNIAGFRFLEHFGPGFGEFTHNSRDLRLKQPLFQAFSFAPLLDRGSGCGVTGFHVGLEFPRGLGVHN